MLNPLSHLTLKNFADGLRNGEFSALQITQSFFDHIHRTNPDIHAYLSLNEDEAVRQAEEADIKIAKGENVSILAGAPLAIKDNILIEGLPATAASKILEHYKASYDAFVIKKLKEQGSVFLGKTNLDEFAMGASTENSAYGPTKNPHDAERVPGGSSGGSAAAVAGHMALAALGSDTGGSIRQPAAFCGTVGLKTTYGSVSRSGLISLASSLDQIGPITKTVEDAAILFDAIKGSDSLDSTSTDHDYGDLLNPELSRIKELKIGLPKEYFENDLSSDVKEGVALAIEKIKSLGLKFKEISLPHSKYGVSTYYIVLPAEASSNLARFDGIRYGQREGEDAGLRNIYTTTKGKGFGAEPKRRIILGTFVLSSGYYDAYYEKAQRVRALINKDFDEAFKEVDIILTPVTPTSAWKIGEKSDPLSMYLADIFTIPANLAGIPAISIPSKTNSKMPVAFQLIGRKFGEADILGLGQFYERI